MELNDGGLPPAMIRPYIQFLLVKFYATPAGAQRHLIAALSGHIIVALL
jgi:hypothetical protein